MAWLNNVVKQTYRFRWGRRYPLCFSVSNEYDLFAAIYRLHCACRLGQCRLHFEILLVGKQMGCSHCCRPSQLPALYVMLAEMFALWFPHVCCALVVTSCAQHAVCWNSLEQLSFQQKASEGAQQAWTEQQDCRCKPSWRAALCWWETQQSPANGFVIPITEGKLVAVLLTVFCSRGTVSGEYSQLE